MGSGGVGGRVADRLNQKTRVSGSYSNMPYATSKICGWKKSGGNDVYAMFSQAYQFNSPAP